MTILSGNLQTSHSSRDLPILGNLVELSTKDYGYFRQIGKTMINWFMNGCKQIPIFNIADNLCLLTLYCSLVDGVHVCRIACLIDLDFQLKFSKPPRLIPGLLHFL